MPDNDACTGWPDGWPAFLGGTGTEFRACCVEHDRAYETAGSLLDYLDAHWTLATCVGGVMGAIMLGGLVTFGSLYIVHRHNRHRDSRDNDWR